MARFQYSRRLFLAQSVFWVGCASGLKSGIVGSSAKSRRKGLVFQSYSCLGRGAKTEDGVLVFDLDRGEMSHFLTPFNVHQIEPLVGQSVGLGANKYGPHFATFDLSQKTLLKSYRVPSGYDLMGHAAQSYDGKYLCLTATRSGTHNLILMLNPQSFEIVGELDLPFSDPPAHDLRFLPNSHTLVTTGGKNAISIDMNDRKIKTIPFDLKPKHQVRHFAMNSAGDMVAQVNEISTSSGWSYSSGALAAHSFKGGFHRVLGLSGEVPSSLLDNEIFDFTFSPEGDLVCATVMGERRIVFWRPSSGEVVRELELPYAPVRAVTTWDNGHYVFISPRSLTFVRTKDFRIEDDGMRLSEGLRSFFLEKTRVTLSHETLI